MEIIFENLTIERAYDIDALSSFSCGVREIDQLIHKKNDGLKSFVCQTPCECYLVKYADETVAVFVVSRRTITLEDSPEDTLELDFLAVKQGFREKRIRSIVIEQIEAKAREDDYHFITTDAFVNRRYSAIGFYLKKGFEIIGEKQINAVPMLKYLEP